MKKARLTQLPREAVVQAGGILWGDPFEFFFDCEVYIKDERIIALIQDGKIIKSKEKDKLKIQNKIKSAKKINRKGLIFIPALVNAHVHFELSFLKGKIPEGSGMTAFIEKVISLKKKNFDKINSRNALLKAISEAIFSGTLLIGDVGNGTWHIPEIIQTPLEGIFFHEIMGLDEKMADDIFKKGLCRAKKVSKTIREKETNLRRERWKVSLSPHSPYSMSEKLQIMVAKWLRENQFAPVVPAAPVAPVAPVVYSKKSKTFIPATIHFAESLEEKKFLNNKNSTFNELYKKLGFLFQRPPLEFGSALKLWANAGQIFVHGVFLDKKEIFQLKNIKGIVLCPRSNNFITGAKASYKLFKERKVPVALGTDSLASNTDLNLFQEMRAAVKFYRISPQEAFYLASKGGACVLGREKDFGSLDIDFLAKWIGIKKDFVNREALSEKEQSSLLLVNFFSKLLEFSGHPVIEVFY